MFKIEVALQIKEEEVEVDNLERGFIVSFVASQGTLLTNVIIDSIEIFKEILCRVQNLEGYEWFPNLIQKLL